MKTIAFLGLGAMGQRIASNLLAAGYPLHIYNRTAETYQPLVEKGAKPFSSPREAAYKADVIISMVTDDCASKSIWLDSEQGAILSLKSHHIAIEFSTLSQNWCNELASTIHKTGASFIDAPVVGSRPQAEACQLIHLVGGQTGVLEKATHLLKTSASAIHHMGDSGTGMTMKLAVNALFGIQVAALSEIFAVLQQHNISIESAVNTLNDLPITSPALKGIASLIAANNYAPLFPVKLVEKDFSYMQKLAENNRLDIPCVNTARDVYLKACKSGYAEDNIAGVVKLYL